MSGRGLVGAALVALALSGCRTTGAHRPRAVGEGLAVTIAQPVDGAAGWADVDDRRLVALPASGTIDLPGVAPGLDPTTLALESLSHPGAARFVRCAVIDPAAVWTAGWLLGQAVDVTTAGGARVQGTVSEVGEPVGVVDVVELDAVGPRLDVPWASLSTPEQEGAPVVGARVDSVLLDRPGRLVDVGVASLAIRDGDGRRHALRADAIARLVLVDVATGPALRCDVETGAPGRHLVRLAYRVPGVGWQASYQVARIEPDAREVDVQPRYTVDPLGLAADGRPRTLSLAAVPTGAASAPVEVWRGAPTTTTGASTVVGPSSRRPARVRLLFQPDGAAAALARDGDGERDEDTEAAMRTIRARIARGPGRTGAGAASEVWRELAIERAATDVPGELAVAVDDGAGGRRWLRATVAPVQPGARLLRVLLAREPALVGFRRRLVHDDVEGGLVDELRYSLANHGAAPVRVLIEESLRPEGTAAVRFAAPAGGVLSARAWQLEVDVAPGGLVRAAVALQYAPAP